MKTFKEYIKEWQIAETPIADIQMRGSWDQGDKKKLYGYKQDDIKILTNPSAIQKIKNKWFNTKDNFIFYFIRSPEGKKNIEQGEVNSTWIKGNLHLDINPTDDSITILFMNNMGAERMPLTAWVMAHRFGHAIRRTSEYQYARREVFNIFKHVLDNLYDYSPTIPDMYYNNYKKYQDSQRLLKDFATSIGTMRSARDKNLRNFEEFYHELLAQYLLTKKITFNPLPQSIGSSAFGRKALYARKDKTEYNEYIQNSITEIEGYFEYMLQDFNGRIFAI